ncbi:MAG TPA: ABC transporter substrate-binding protein [Usitatibacter sp.]|jgi:peptide/nickel transport system substrate-binding protein|nr:ABC transporter substrate-binding protein [Usitatibacter sp.]
MLKPIAAAIAAAVLAAPLAGAQTLRIGLAEDPDVLDPTLARTFVGRIVFAGLCDKLVDIDKDLKIIPQLATSWEWSKDQKSLTMKIRQGVTFHDGEKLDAAAVKFNIERHKTMQGSNRRGELAPVTGVDVVDPYTVRLNLAAPFAPLLAQLADRSGMMVSPKAAQAAGEKFSAHPVCAGPFKFVDRIAQGKISLERFPNYWNKGAIHFDKVTYEPVVDPTARLASLKSGQLDFIERVNPSDMPALKGDPKVKAAKIVEIGYQGITINIGKSEESQKTALGKDPRVREAFELSLDRDAIVQVAMDGEAVAGNQWVAPTNTWYAKSEPIPKRDVNRAKALLREAGVTNPSFTLLTPTTADAQRVAQVVQSMAKEAGFDVKIQLTEFATTLNLADKGQYEAFVLAWSGRADPDGNIYSHLVSKQPLNYAGYANADFDRAITESRETNDAAQRAKLFEQAAKMEHRDRPIVYLYHRQWLWAHTNRLQGFRPVPDGMVRLQDLKLN